MLLYVVEKKKKKRANHLKDLDLEKCACVSVSVNL